MTPDPPPAPSAEPPPDPVAAALVPLIDAGEAAVLARLPLLSNQERAVWALTGRGMRAKAVAWELAISPKTAETHLARLRVKLGGEGGPLSADDLAFLARLWVRAGGGGGRRGGQDRGGHRASGLPCGSSARLSARGAFAARRGGGEGRERGASVAGAASAVACPCDPPRPDVPAAGGAPGRMPAMRDRPSVDNTTILRADV